MVHRKILINGLVTCVNYADFLELGIKRWISGLHTLTIVTDTKDHATRDLARRYGCRVAATDLFYADGATFNKGRAMEWARKYVMQWSDWILLFDADIVPQTEWKEVLDNNYLVMGSLYGTTRYDCQSPKDIDKSKKPMPHDVPGVGFFQLFHSEDPIVKPLPVIPTEWVHAGNYDNELMDKWRKKRIPIQRVPVSLYHVGERDNWWGRGNKDAFRTMQLQRQQRGGRWDHEVILGGNPPID